MDFDDNCDMSASSQSTQEDKKSATSKSLDSSTTSKRQLDLEQIVADIVLKKLGHMNRPAYRLQGHPYHLHDLIFVEDVGEIIERKSVLTFLP